MSLPTLLHIETSNTVCSVCISKGAEVVALRENIEGNMHATLLTPYIEETLAEVGITAYGLDGISLSIGPGSYTGLRIGASAAKALCYATGKPLITISTLQAMVAGYIAKHGPHSPHTLFCPMIDARRMEVYAALYESTLKGVKEPQPWIIENLDFFEGYAKDNTIICLGNGAEKIKGFLAENQVIIDGNDYLSALNLVPLALRQMKLGVFSDTSYFEPQYLKSAGITHTKH